MEMELDWRSQQGTKTGDNRDYGGAGIRPDGVLCLVLDGSTSGPKSGELAGQIARDVIDWYVATAEDVTAETLTAQLRQIHGSLSKRFPRDTASYVIVCLAGTGPALVLHAGDCLLGRQAGKSPLQWLIRPHTLANVIDDIPVAEIAESYVKVRDQLWDKKQFEDVYAKLQRTRESVKKVRPSLTVTISSEGKSELLSAYTYGSLMSANVGGSYY